jgi:hypothetical protein
MGGFSSQLSPYLTSDKDDSHLDFNKGFGTSLTPFLSAAGEAGHNIQIYSGFRSPEHQGRLYDAALEKYGSEAAARKWVAPPGKSQHNHGGAADLRFGSDEAKTWAHNNAVDFGLNFRMDYEPWHIEQHPDHKANKLGSSYSAALLGENNTEEAQPTLPDEEPSANAQLSLTAAKDSKQEPAEEKEYKPFYAAAIQSSVTDGLQDAKMFNVAEASMKFFQSLSPQQRMMEQQAYMNSRRQDKEQRNIEEWFSTERFPSYVNGFSSSDPQTLGNLSQVQKQALGQAVESLGSLETGKVMGLA